MSDCRVRRSRLFRATPRRHPDAGTSFGSQAAHDRQTAREPDARDVSTVRINRSVLVDTQSDGSGVDVAKRFGPTGKHRMREADPTNGRDYCLVAVGPKCSDASSVPVVVLHSDTAHFRLWLRSPGVRRSQICVA
jgi:hypothetical protein